MPAGGMAPLESFDAARLALPRTPEYEVAQLWHEPQLFEKALEA